MIWVSTRMMWCFCCLLSTDFFHFSQFITTQTATIPFLLLPTKGPPKIQINDETLNDDLALLLTYKLKLDLNCQLFIHSIKMLKDMCSEIHHFWDGYHSLFAESRLKAPPPKIQIMLTILLMLTTMLTIILFSLKNKNLWFGVWSYLELTKGWYIGCC